MYLPTKLLSHKKLLILSCNNDICEKISSKISFYTIIFIIKVQLL